MKVHAAAYFAGLLALGASPAVAADVPTAISDCHLDNSTPFCVAGPTEYEVHLPASVTLTAVPAEYTGCHTHDEEMFCVDPDGEDVEIHILGEEEEHGEEEEGQTCHFHAGVEHCTGDAEAATVDCGRTSREYNVPLRVGLLFVILATSALGVFGPIAIQKMLPARFGLGFTILKQFGTGVIISTAFIHLYTHATLMFENQCLAGQINYESTPAAILMAGLFLSFLVEYLGQRYVRHKAKKAAAASAASSAGFAAILYQKTEMINIMVLEAGIIFHSLLIGLTLVVAGDSFFKTLFVVILFHQMFEGIALGSRIAALGTGTTRSVIAPHGHHHHHAAAVPVVAVPSSGGEGEETKGQSDQSNETSSSTADTSSIHPAVPMKKKLFLALAFALVTPIGMAIGIAVLNQFNGNDPSTLIAIGTLDALSAGILIWVGVVEMWAEDWMMGGELTDASVVTTVLSLVGLVAGMALMSLLGKWA